jgi:hypothetical protein
MLISDHLSHDEEPVSRHNFAECKRAQADVAAEALVPVEFSIRGQTRFGATRNVSTEPHPNDTR